MRLSIKRGIVVMVLFAILGGILGCAQSAASSNAQVMETPLTATVVRVSTTEMQIIFDPPPTRAGKITFVVTNEGHTEHNFVLQGNGKNYATRQLAPGTIQTLTVDLAPGRYDFLCGIPGHAMLGMRGSFTLN